jgi:MFS family permease
MAANTLTLAVWYGREFTDIALLTGWHLCGVGIAGFFCVPTARVWGKRHLFIAGAILTIISCAWAGGSQSSYKSLFAARIFQGFALAPFEALVNACVGDLYFVHVSRVFPILDQGQGSFLVTNVYLVVRNGESGWRFPTLRSSEGHS